MIFAYKTKNIHLCILYVTATLKILTGHCLHICNKDLSCFVSGNDYFGHDQFVCIIISNIVSSFHIASTKVG